MGFIEPDFLRGNTIYFAKNLDIETAAEVANMAKRIFGDSAEMYFPFLYDRFANAVIGFTYSFTPMDRFTKIDNLAFHQEVYWREMISRCHYTAITSVLRHMKWLDGVMLAASFGNWFSFAANFRGLIESFADAVDSLTGVPYSLSENFNLINAALESRATCILTAGDLEKQLIHYSHAHVYKRRKDKEVPSEHIVKSTQAYLKQLTLNSPSLEDLPDSYATLCQITHPAAHTVAFFFDVNEDGMLLTTAVGDDMAEIANFCQRNQHMMYALFQKSFNLALITLKLINRMSMPDLYVAVAEIPDFSQVGMWQKIEQQIEENTSL